MKPKSLITRKRVTAIILITTYICFMNIFISYLIGSTTVFVNNYGEGNFEMLLFIVTLPFVAKYLYDEILK